MPGPIQPADAADKDAERAKQSTTLINQRPVGGDSVIATSKARGANDVGVGSGNDAVDQPLHSGESRMDVDPLPSCSHSAESELPQPSGARPEQPEREAPASQVHDQQGVNSLGDEQSPPSSQSGHSQLVSNATPVCPSDTRRGGQPSEPTPATTYQSTAVGTPPSCTTFSDAAVSTEDLPRSALPGVDPHVIEYVEKLGLSADVACKLGAVGLKNIAMVHTMRDIVSESRKDKLEEELQNRAGLSFLEAVVFVSGLRRPESGKP